MPEAFHTTPFKTFWGCVKSLDAICQGHTKDNRYPFRETVAYFNGLLVILVTFVYAKYFLMEIRQAEFLGSFPGYLACPADGMPEFAFIGRSNVGKSSLINMLCQRTALAHTSKKPGKTQTINLFLINNQWRLVDLPGYGYATVSKSQRVKWEKMIRDYLSLRDEMVCAFVLLDANIPPQKLDIEFINWLGAMSVPFALVYTKTDRLKPAELTENLKHIQTAILEYWTHLPPQFITSSNNGLGRDEILAYIDSLHSELST